jgi:hypothetical protein
MFPAWDQSGAGRVNGGETPTRLAFAYVRLMISYQTLPTRRHVALPPSLVRSFKVPADYSSRRNISEPSCRLDIGTTFNIAALVVRGSHKAHSLPRRILEYRERRCTCRESSTIIRTRAMRRGAARLGSARLPVPLFFPQGRRHARDVCVCVCVCVCEGTPRVFCPCVSQRHPPIIRNDVPPVF